MLCGNVKQENFINETDEKLFLTASARGKLKTKRKRFFAGKEGQNSSSVLRRKPKASGTWLYRSGNLSSETNFLTRVKQERVPFPFTSLHSYFALFLHLHENQQRKTRMYPCAV